MAQVAAKDHTATAPPIRDPSPPPTFDSGQPPNSTTANTTQPLDLPVNLDQVSTTTSTSVLPQPLPPPPTTPTTPTPPTPPQSPTASPPTPDPHTQPSFPAQPPQLQQPHHPHLPSPMLSAFADLSLSQPPQQPQQIYQPAPQLLPIQPLPALVPQHRHPLHPQPPAHPHHLIHPHHHIHAQTYYMWVPQERVGAVIGGHGAVIRSLQERSGATIQVHNDTVRDDQKLFTIFGTLAQYELAKSLILDIIEKPRHPHPHSASSDRGYSGGAEHSHVEQALYKTVYVPTSCVGLVIGRNGETIRNLQDLSAAEIKVTPDEEATPGDENRSILISGSEDAIAKAHQLVSEIVMDARSRRPPHSAQQVGVSLNGQPLVLEVLSVPNEKVGLIIGKKGAAIRELQLKSGAKIQVTKDDTSVQSDGTRPVTITGMRANVDDAKAMIASKINVPMLQPAPPNNYNNSPQQGVSAASTPSAAAQPVPYLVPNMYEPSYQNGQAPFQQMYESSDPNAQNRATIAYFHQFFGYNNYAALAQQQQRQYQPQLSLHYPPHPHQQQQPPQQQPQVSQEQTLHISHPDQQEHIAQTQQHPQQQQQFVSQHMQLQGQQLDGMQPSPAQMVPRDPNGNVLIFPHPYQQLPHQLGPHPIYPSAPPNSRMFSRREHVHVAQAQAQEQMLMQAQAQNQQVHAQHAHAQGAQAHAMGEPDGEPDGQPQQTLQSTPSPTLPTTATTPPEDAEQPNG